VRNGQGRLVFLYKMSDLPLKRYRTRNYPNPVAFNGARRVRRGGWGNTPVERREGAPCPYSTEWR
jgi:hypothetical protein